MDEKEQKLFEDIFRRLNSLEKNIIDNSNKADNALK